MVTYFLKALFVCTKQFIAILKMYQKCWGKNEKNKVLLFGEIKEAVLVDTIDTILNI